MANTVTQRTLFGSATTKKVVRVAHIIGVDAQESDLVIYDNSAFIADVTKGKINKIKVIGKNSGIARIEFDQTADSPIAVFGDQGGEVDFSHIGGVGSPGGAGATGDIVLTTVGLAANDEIAVYIEVDQD